LLPDRTPEVASTANCAISAAVFDATAGHGIRFDPVFNNSGGEDTEYALRAERQFGLRVRGCPDAIVFEPRSGARATLGYQLRRTLRSQILSFRIAAMHRKAGIMQSTLPLPMILLSKTNRNFVFGIGILLRAVLTLPFAPTKGQRGIGLGLERLTQSIAIVPYMLGYVPLDYGQTKPT
jgi:hypothetical protein